MHYETSCTGTTKRLCKKFMKIGFQIRSDIHKWGGDLGVLYALKKALQTLGHECSFASSPLDLLQHDYLFLTNSCFDLRPAFELLEAVGKPFGIIPFHEDILRYQSLAVGFYRMIASQLSLEPLISPFMREKAPYLPTLDHLTLHPSLAGYYSQPPKPFALYNRAVLASTLISIASSQEEANSIRRDCPLAKTAIIPWAIPERSALLPDDSFLKWTGLASGSYLLQIGRLQARKNQLASIIATRDIDLPLVLIALEGFENHYEKTCVEAALRWRRAPTLLISQTWPTMQKGFLRILPMPDHKKLPENILWSALHHAGLYVHPAFQELPGLVFLEAAACGVPMVASSWCTIHEYFHDGKFDGRILYPLPHDLRAIEEGVRQLFGKRFLTPCPATLRSPLDVAQDFLAVVNRHFA
jgi:glycosyltransferase involved in cell wall biosynthesis